MQKEHFEGLVAALEAQGMTRSEIAHGAGVSRDTVWRLATGNARRPSHETIERLKLFSQNRDAVRPIGQLR